MKQSARRGRKPKQAIRYRTGTPPPRTLSDWRKEDRTRPPVVVQGQLEPVYVHVGRICREQRDRLGLPQHSVAALIGHTGSALSRIECGKQRLPLHELFEIARVLCIRPRDLLPEGWVDGEDAP